MNLAQRWLIVLLMASFFEAIGQNKISGRVVDANTGEPLPFANVFFSGTSIGTSTNEGGWFSITGFASGKYDFTVSFVGYLIYRQSYTFTGSEQVKLLIKLGPDEQQLREIVVTPNDHNRKANYEHFKRLFLGGNKFAKQCEIMNPDDIYVYRDELMVTAHAFKPIVIENRALGYRIQYHLALFEHNSFSGKLDVYGFPQFEELKPKNGDELEVWQRTREEVYRGSLTHFMRSLLGNELIEQTFFVSRVFHLPNPERLPDEILARRIDSLKAELVKINADHGAQSIRQKISEYGSMKLLPAYIDSFASETLRGHELINPDTLNLVDYRGTLIVRFGEKERGKDAAPHGVPRIQYGLNSMVSFRSPFMIYQNGYFDNLGNMIVEGYWSTSEKVSMILPLDYAVKDTPGN